jgi:hypothetical protein
VSNNRKPDPASELEALAQRATVQQEAKRADFRAKFPDLCPVLESLAALYGREAVKLRAAINTDGDEVGAVDDAFREAAKQAWEAPPVVVPELPKRRRK